MKRARRILMGGLVGCVALTVYGIAYYRVPIMRCPTGDVRVEQKRCFAKDFEPYFFAPAGAFEALLVRAARRIHPQGPCGEVICLCTSRVRIEIRAKADPPPNDKPIPWDADILDYVLQRDVEIYGQPVFAETTLPDGSKRRSRNGNIALDDAEDFLRDRYPRPYTLDKVVRWYEQASDQTTRIHLLTLIAASRDPNAALIVGDALLSTSLEVRVAAVEAFNWYFGATQCSFGGSTETAFIAAFKWLEENGPRLYRYADNHPIH